MGKSFDWFNAEKGIAVDQKVNGAGSPGKNGRQVEHGAGQVAHQVFQAAEAAVADEESKRMDGEVWGPFDGYTGPFDELRDLIVG